MLIYDLFIANYVACDQNKINPLTEAARFKARLVKIISRQLQANAKLTTFVVAMDKDKTVQTFDKLVIKYSLHVYIYIYNCIEMYLSIILVTKFGKLLH